jgi:hypothetical protein
MCQQAWDNFNEEKVFMNDDLRKNARAVFNKESEEEFHIALYDSDADYSRLARFVLDCLVSRRLLLKEEYPGRDPTYWRTQKLKELCPKITDFDLPVIDPLVDDYERQHHLKQEK